MFNFNHKKNKKSNIFIDTSKKPKNNVKNKLKKKCKAREKEIFNGDVNFSFGISQSNKLNKKIIKIKNKKHGKIKIQTGRINTIEIDKEDKKQDRLLY